MRAIPSRGSYSLKAVGESHYQDALRRLVGDIRDDLPERELPAILRLLQWDGAPAVRVDMNGETVGHLSKEDAESFQRLFAEDGDGDDTFVCHGKIEGRVSRGREMFGVRLDVSLAERVAGQRNADGQLIEARIHERRRASRGVTEMLGLIKGILIDGAVSADEARALDRWVRANPDVTLRWPGNLLADRLRKIFADGVVTEDERNDLLELLVAMVGEAAPSDPEAGNASTTLPFDDPPPDLTFVGQTYAFTGRFAFGTRSECQQAVVRKGANFMNRITRELDVLVIGALGSRDWIQTSYGLKIEQAVENREKGYPIKIVSEEHWALFLRQ